MKQIVLAIAIMQWGLPVMAASQVRRVAVSDTLLTTWHRLGLQSQRYSALNTKLSSIADSMIDKDSAMTPGSLWDANAYAVDRLTTDANVAENSLLAASDLLYLFNKITNHQKRVLAWSTVDTRLDSYRLDHILEFKRVSALIAHGLIKDPAIAAIALQLRDELRNGSDLLEIVLKDFSVARTTQIDSTKERAQVRLRDRKILACREIMDSLADVASEMARRGKGNPADADRASLSARSAATNRYVAEHPICQEELSEDYWLKAVSQPSPSP